jgi:hypothetical protein
MNRNQNLLNALYGLAKSGFLCWVRKGEDTYEAKLDSSTVMVRQEVQEINYYHNLFSKKAKPGKRHVWIITITDKAGQKQEILDYTTSGAEFEGYGYLIYCDAWMHAGPLPTDSELEVIKEIRKCYPLASFPLK